MCATVNTLLVRGDMKAALVRMTVEMNESHHALRGVFFYLVNVSNNGDDYNKLLTNWQ